MRSPTAARLQGGLLFFHVFSELFLFLLPKHTHQHELKTVVQTAVSDLSGLELRCVR